MANEPDWLSSYVDRLRDLKLGELVEMMIDLKISQMIVASNDLDVLAERSLKIETLRNEISNRETGRKDRNPSPMKKVRSLKGFI